MAAGRRAVAERPESTRKPLRFVAALPPLRRAGALAYDCDSRPPDQRTAINSPVTHTRHRSAPVPKSFATKACWGDRRPWVWAFTGHVDPMARLKTCAPRPMQGRACIRWAGRRCDWSVGFRTPWPAICCADAYFSSHVIARKSSRHSESNSSRAYFSALTEPPSGPAPLFCTFAAISRIVRRPSTCWT